MSIYPDHRQWSDFLHSKATNHFPFHCKKIRLNRYFPAHRHDFLEFSFIIEGEGYQFIDNKKYVMGPGTLMLLLPYQVQEMMPEADHPLQLYNCAFDVHLLRSALIPGAGLEDLLALDEELPPSVQLIDEESNIVEELFQKMVGEYEDDKRWRVQQIQSYLWSLLIQFDRLRAAKHRGHGHAHGHDDSSESSFKHHSLTIWNASRYVHLHYNQPLTLSELSDRFGMSNSYLSEQFKKHLGINFVRFLHEIRVRHACSLLVSTEMSVLDIAIEVGCGSSRSFTRIFQEIKGLTPTQYRKQLTEKPDDDQH